MKLLQILTLFCLAMPSQFVIAQGLKNDMTVIGSAVALPPQKDLKGLKKFRLVVKTDGASVSDADLEKLIKDNLSPLGVQFTKGSDVPALAFALDVVHRGGGAFCIAEIKVIEYVLVERNGKLYKTTAITFDRAVQGSADGSEAVDLSASVVVETLSRFKTAYEAAQR